ncbi:lytic transglycosylase domain-containing protein [Caproiciproducens galactitolivorans]|uniref:lytic transglycosylase domain-containing protein n=1 Tax=Caproiciproducens galactitolivorans TaxID=642589 RepID=UPI002409DE0E|nr:lytic transglycosylase domain-containing protein [Caproiciproducens galactitolivorans]
MGAFQTNTRIESNPYRRIQPSNRSSTGIKKATGTSFSGLLQNAVKKIDNKKLDSGSMEEIFQTAAEKYNVPLNLLKAVAKAESGFDASAVSRCGAQGVMQLMPATAKALGVEDPLDAEQNIMGGAKYLSDLISRYDGDVKLALAAYNAGSGNVAKYGGIPPFKETQAYVKKVMSYAGEDLSAEDISSQTDSLSALSSLMGYSPAYSTAGLNSVGTMNSLSALGTLLRDSSATAAVPSGSQGANSTAFTYDDYLLFLQLYTAQLQMNATRSMASAASVSDLFSSDSGTGSMFLL